MTESEVLGASQARLNSWAEFLGLRQVGKRGTWWVRKSARHAVTKQDFVLKHSTRTPDLRTAILRAQPEVQKFLAGIQTHLAPLVSSSKGPQTTVGEVLDNYLAWEHGQTLTRTRNAYTLERILREAHPQAADVRALSIEAVDDKLARSWLRQQEEAAGKEFLPHDREGFERRKRSRNQALANAQSIFSRRALQRYRDMGLVVSEGAKAFAQELGLEARPAPPPEDFTAEELAAIRGGLPKLKESDPAAYAAVMLTLYAGLRNIENLSARWAWVGTLGEQTMLDLSTQGGFEPKGRDGWVQIDPVLLVNLPCLHYPPAPDDHLVPAATEYERRLACYRGVNTFLAGCGVRKINGKLAYRARGHAITQIFLDHGPAAAKEFARHSTQRTTERYYIGVKAPYAPRAVLAG